MIYIPYNNSYRIMSEGFDFDNGEADVDDAVSTSLNTDDVKERSFKAISIVRVLAYMGIPKPIKSSEIWDDGGRSALVYYSTNKSIFARNAYASSSEPKPIKDFKNLLINDKGWQHIHNMDDNEYCIYDHRRHIGMRFGGTVDEALLSPDEGLILILYKPRSIIFGNDVYDFGWSIEYTGKVGYADKVGNGAKKPKRVKRNYRGLPLVAPTVEEAQDLYDEYAECCTAINAFSSRYWDAYRKEYCYLDDKYKPDKKPYDHPDRKAMDKEMEDWEAQAKHEYKLDRPEYKEFTQNEKVLRQKLKDTLDQREIDRVKEYSSSGKTKPMKEIYRLKWCPQHPVFEWYPVWKRYYDWYETVK